MVIDMAVVEGEVVWCQVSSLRLSGWLTGELGRDGTQCQRRNYKNPALLPESSSLREGEFLTFASSLIVMRFVSAVSGFIMSSMYVLYCMYYGKYE